MRKSKSMRMASGLLVLTMLSTCMISGTFARYTTQDNASDTARVAKWGVELQVAGDLYSENYTATTNVAQVGTTDASVQTMASGENLVAPGTMNKKGLVFSLNGQPEVSGMISAKFEYENVYLKANTYGVMVEYGTDGTMSQETYNTIKGAVTFPDTDLYIFDGSAYKVSTDSWSESTKYYTLEDYVVLGADYYPVEYQLVGTGANGTSYNADFTADCTVDTLAVAVDTIKNVLFAGCAPTISTVDGKTTVVYENTNVTKFDPKTELAATFKLSDEKLIWKWDYQQESSAEVYDKADTILGNLMDVSGSTVLNGTVVKESAGTFVAPAAAAGGAANDYNLKTSFSMDITVTQVD